MENWKELIPHKSYNWFGNVVLTLFFLTAGTYIGIGIAVDMKVTSNFRCNPDKNLAVDLSQKTYVETSCSLQYEQKYHSPVPLYGLVTLKFGIVLSLCIIYAYSVKSHIESLDRINTRTNDAELQPLSEQKSQSNQENEQKPCIPVFYVYIFHLLFGRALPMVLFAVLVFYPADFSTEFVCRLPPSNLSMPDFASGSNFTTVECKSTLGSKNSFWRKQFGYWILFSR